MGSVIDLLPESDNSDKEVSLLLEYLFINPDLDEKFILENSSLEFNFE
uniref:Uncharacterized protein n=1 Tax=Pithovirus LCDPAC02 TaxID=2506601 RepID=A0A481YNK6_9VIRU|nr:MAG: hypothetical protein LCDPAC02_00570 [Pithovirus LCDPAC02]